MILYAEDANRIRSRHVQNLQSETILEADWWEDFKRPVLIEIASAKIRQTLLPILIRNVGPLAI